MAPRNPDLGVVFGRRNTSLASTGEPVQDAPTSGPLGWLPQGGGGPAQGTNATYRRPPGSPASNQQPVSKFTASPQGLAATPPPPGKAKQRRAF